MLDLKRMHVMALAFLMPAMLLLADSPSASGAASFRRMVEQDWLLRERLALMDAQADGRITTEGDAAGGCDGVKDGRYGFHTNYGAPPWWQVDLGAVHALSHVLVWNRCDGASERILGFHILLSDDGAAWRCAFVHDGAPFQGYPGKKPLRAALSGGKARFVRIQVPRKTYLHLDEVEVFGVQNPDRNLALHGKADQSGTSQWSHVTALPVDDGPAWLERVNWAKRIREVMAHSEKMILAYRQEGLNVADDAAALDRLAETMSGKSEAHLGRAQYIEARWIARRLALKNPLLDAPALLFTKRVPGSFNHMSDQYLGWWSRPGGGLYLLKNYKGDNPETVCLSGDPMFKAPGSFLRPDLSYDGRKILFAWCRHYPTLAAERNKLDKANVPEDAFYHVFEMNIDGTGVRRLTRGKYDNFDARYLPGGGIVFCSTRRGQSIQCGFESARRSLLESALPDVYVRCGGGPERPCTVYTLHTMDNDGGNLCAISPFEMFEWNPSVGHDGSILYSRWDYIDRSNMPYMSLWAINPDGANARLVYANFSRTPHCTFEPRAIPGSRKLVFTASAHHSQTKGSLVLFDPAVGDEGAAPITRLTPEVAFPESEGWPLTYYANPWPLSERFYLVAWGPEGVQAPATSLGWDRWHSVGRPANGMGLYLFDAHGNMELLHKDPDISCLYPMPLKPRERPVAVAGNVDLRKPQEGAFLLHDVYHGLSKMPRGTVKSLRIVAVPAKTHPTMNFPNLGVTRDDPGKCVLGTVPVEADGSAYFRVPSGVIVFFQALDARGMAVQTMRSTTHVQPGQTLSCIGCHEQRDRTPANGPVMASRRPPSRIILGPEGSWPLRFDRLVQPVLDGKCVRCHRPGHEDRRAAQIDLTSAKAYDTLVGYGKPSLRDHVRARYGQGRSVEGGCVAGNSRLLALLMASDKHHGVTLSEKEIQRLVVWMDTYAQRTGSFSAWQERDLEALKESSRAMLTISGE